MRSVIRTGAPYSSTCQARTSPCVRSPIGFRSVDLRFLATCDSSRTPVSSRIDRRGHAGYTGSTEQVPQRFGGSWKTYGARRVPGSRSRLRTRHQKPIRMIEPLVVSFRVDAPVGHAFAMWTQHASLWWPRSHTITKDDTLDIVFEDRVGVASTNGPLRVLSTTGGRSSRGIRPRHWSTSGSCSSTGPTPLTFRFHSSGTQITPRSRSRRPGSNVLVMLEPSENSERCSLGKRSVPCSSNESQVDRNTECHHGGYGS